MQTSIALTYTHGLHCEARRPDGSLMPMDSAMVSGPDRGHSPLELLALAHGACTAMVMSKVAASLGLDLAGMQVEVEHQYRPGPPMMLQSARIRFRVPCPVDADQSELLRNGATACPVHSALRHDIPVVLELVQA